LYSRRIFPRGDRLSAEEPRGYLLRVSTSHAERQPLSLQRARARHPLSRREPLCRAQARRAVPTLPEPVAATLLPAGGHGLLPYGENEPLPVDGHRPLPCHHTVHSCCPLLPEKRSSDRARSTNLG